MLKSLRDGAKSGFLKFILLGFMALAVGGLVLTDVGGFFRGGVSSNNVAEGKHIEISTVEFDRLARRVLSRQGLAPQDAYARGLIHQILNNEIQTRIITREARDLGLVVGDETVMEQISKLATPLAQNGTSKSDALKQILRAQGISEAEFIASIRQEMANGLLTNAVFSNAGYISDAQAEAIYLAQNETREFKGALLNADQIKDVEAPTEEQLQNYYNSNKSDFRIAERRDITIATLKQEMLEDKVNITDEELRQDYEDNIETYQKPEQRKVQQAVLSSPDEAQKVLNNINEGKSLENAVENVTGSKDAYLGENEFSKNGLLEEISAPVFDAEKGDVIGPIETSLGHHVIVLKDIIEPQTTPFEKVKESIRDNMLGMRLAEDLINTANMIDDQLAGGTPLSEIVNELSLTTQSYTDLNQAGFNKNVKDVLSDYQGDKAQILEAAFDFEVGEASPVMELADGRFITVKVDNIEEASYEPFDSVKSQLEKRWVNEQQALANQARAEDLLAALKSGTSLEDAAKEAGLNIKTFSNLKNNEEPQKPLLYGYVAQMFNADLNEPIMITTGPGFLIGQVTKIELPDAENADKNIEKIKTQISEGLSNEIFAQYINSLAQKYNVKINDAALREIYGPQGS